VLVDGGGCFGGSFGGVVSLPIVVFVVSVVFMLFGAVVLNDSYKITLLFGAVVLDAFCRIIVLLFGTVVLGVSTVLLLVNLSKS
jgi:hypothetical protein